jgi:hypothetical protein
MGKQAKVQAYMTAILQNPKFFEWAAKRYGQLQTTGEGLVCDVAVAPLATAISHLEKHLTETLPEDPKAN